MPRSNNRSRGSHNNNPSGRKQYSSDWGVTELVRERPIAAAAAAAGAAAAGLFLWSRRQSISNQLSQISDQIGEWTGQMGEEIADDTAGLTTATSRGSSTTGGGNAGRRSGGGGVQRTASGRGRVRTAARTSEMS